MVHIYVDRIVSVYAVLFCMVETGDGETNENISVHLVRFAVFALLPGIYIGVYRRGLRLE